jgi:hypothetical protein
MPKGWKKPSSQKPDSNDIDNIEHKRWLLNQTQAIFRTIFNAREADRLDIETRAEQYKSSMFATRDKILAGLGFTATILLGLASFYNEIRNLLFLILSVDIGIGVALYIFIDVIVYKALFTFMRVKAAHYAPILKLSILEDWLISSSFDINLINIKHLKNFFNYVKLIGMSRFELINEYVNASQVKSLFQQSHYFGIRARDEEMVKNEASSFYRIKKLDFLNDEHIVSYDKELARIFGGTPLLQKYEQLASSSSQQTFKNDEHGITMEFPPDWQIEQAREKRRGIENTIVAAHPSYPFDTEVRLEITRYSKRTVPLNEVIRFELEYKRTEEADMDTILESEPTTVGEYAAHRIIYNSIFKNLVDKVMKVWFSAQGTIFEITYETPNPEKYEKYLDNATGIINSIKIAPSRR